MLARCFSCQKNFETGHYGTQPCPHCGQQVHLADPGAPPPPPPPPAPPPAYWGAAPQPVSPPPGGTWAVGEADAPFVHRASRGWISTFASTWKLACLQPGEFFRSVKIDRSGSAVLFGVIAMTVASWFQTLYGAVMGATTRDMLRQVLQQVPQGSQYQDAWVFQWVSGATFLGTLVQMAFAPFVAAVWILIWAGVYHVALLVLGAATRGFAATLTVVGYASGALLVGAAPVPGLASLVGAVWFGFAAAAGFREAQRTSNGKAWTALLLPFLAVCACCCAAAWMAATGISSLGIGGN